MASTQLLLCKIDGSHREEYLGIVRDIRHYMPQFHENRFVRAFLFAMRAHEGQVRKDGSCYISHPLETVRILIALRVDEDTLIAALLHDVPEDTEYTIQQVEAKFGKKVAFLVEGITKLSKVHYQHQMQKRQIQSLKKLFIHTAKDPRIIIIKLADRLHNMRTLSAIEKKEKRTRIARETLEIFVPIANLLGIEGMKSELEDLSFKYLHPDDFEVINDRMEKNKQSNAGILEKTIDQVCVSLKNHEITAKVFGRNKNLYNIYKRISGKMATLENYDNLISLRILVETRGDCYNALGLIHAMFNPRPGKFKDYIAVPKKNGYQSLHTTVFGINGFQTEFQIRTHQMNLEAEYGIASNYFKHHSDTRKLHLENDTRADWASKILEVQKAECEDADMFMEDIKLDILHDRIFVFTQRGDTIDLPSDASCIDFAYEIGTDIGHRSIKADVNGNYVPMITKLKNGDTVEILTSDVPKGPNRSWLAFAKTHEAKTCILEYFKQVSKDEKINTGRKVLQKEMDRAGLGLIKDITAKRMKSFLDLNKNYKKLDDILECIGEGTLPQLKFIGDIFPEKKTGKQGALSRLFDRLLFHTGPTRKVLVTFKIISREENGQLTKILTVISEQKLSTVKTKAGLALFNNNTKILITVAVDNFSQISSLCENLEQIDGVKRVERQFIQRRFIFLFGSMLTFLIWSVHPYLFHYLSLDLVKGVDPLLAKGLMYSGIFMLFLMVFSMKRLSQRSFPELRETQALLPMTTILSCFAFITLFTEVYIFNLSFNWVILFGFVIAMFAFLTSEFIKYPSDKSE